MKLPDIECGESYLIVGAGVFGASTALHLKQTKPWAQVTLLDRTPFPNPAAASFDLNKIIRADYRDIFYMKLALEALDAWEKDPLYVPHYHPTGMIFAENSGKGSDFLMNYDLLGHKHDAELMSVDEAQARFPVFHDANWTGVRKAYFNPRSGWGEAVPALRSVIQAAIDIGVVYTEASVSKLLLDRCSYGPTERSTRCLGVETIQGHVLHADHVLLCTGAATAKLLADTAPDDVSMQVNGRLVAAAALSCMVRVNPIKWRSIRDAPVFANLMSHTNGEAIPLTADGYIKVNHELSFTNVEVHATSRQMISCTPEKLNQCCWTDDVPQVLKDEAKKVLNHTYGRDAEGFEMESFRLCWDAITQTQDWIIGPHDACENLYIATGGSFHAWKFLPILGRHIVNMLDGRLDDEKTTRWAWTPSADISSGACESYCPKRDLKDIVKADTVRSRV